MRSIFTVLMMAALAAIFPTSPAAYAQQVTVGTPYHSVSDSFYEQMGVNWGIRFPGGFFNFGGGNPGAPPFGNYNPNAGASAGWAFGNGKVNGNMRVTAGQGFQRSMVSQTPMVTLQNGYPGFFSDASMSPFVMGYVPVVGNYPMVPTAMPTRSSVSSGVGADAVRDALQRVQSARAQEEDAPPAQAAAAPRAAPPRRARDDIDLRGAAPAAQAPDGTDDGTAKLAQVQGSSAGRPALSVAESRRLHEAEQATQDQALMALWERAQKAEAAGNLGAARINYQMLSRRADGDLKDKAIQRLSVLKAQQ